MSVHDALQWDRKDILSKLDHWDMIAGDLDETTGVTSDKILKNRDALDLTDDILDLALGYHKESIMEFINDLTEEQQDFLAIMFSDILNENLTHFNIVNLAVNEAGLDPMDGEELSIRIEESILNIIQDLKNERE